MTRGMVVPPLHTAPPIRNRGEAATWMLQTLLPWWLDKAPNAGGGFHEALDAEGMPAGAGLPTTLTHARLGYVFSHAYLVTRESAYLDAALRAIGFIEERTHASASGGWRKTPASEVFDCYDHAFVLFALAWLAAATRDDRHAALAARTWSFIDTQLADRRHGGFFEQAGDRNGMRRQNPHMHLLEACLAWFEVTGDEAWLARADAIIALFLRRFVDPRNGSLVEYFGVDWTPAQGSAGTLREPGHHFEWFWLLDWRMRLAGVADRAALQAAGDALLHFALAHGIETEVDPRGLAWDEIDAAGEPRSCAKLVWPQTELVKALVADAAQRADAPSLARAIAVHRTMLATHFDASRTHWCNQVARNGAPLVRIAPTRILYHLMLSAMTLDDALASGEATAARGTSGPIG